MLYNEEKAREMGRSILPSTQRRGRTKQSKQSRRTRRTARHSLNLMEWSEDGWLDDQQALTDDKEHRVEVRYIVRSQRELDKVAPVQRWAVAITADMRLLDRRAFVAKQLPQNLIGWHAMTHIESLDEFDTEINRLVYRERFSNEWKARAKLHRLWSYYELYSLLERVIAEGRRKALNSVIYGNWQPRVWYTTELHYLDGARFPSLNYKIVMVRHEDLVPPRTLQGRDDINAFMADVFGTGRFFNRSYGAHGGLPHLRDRCLSYLAQVYEYELKER